MQADTWPLAEIFSANKMYISLFLDTLELQNEGNECTLHITLCSHCTQIQFGFQIHCLELIVDTVILQEMISALFVHTV